MCGYILYHAVHASPAAESMQLALYFVATLGAYTAAEVLLGERLLSKASAWPRTAILLGPLVVILALDLGPHVFHHALLLYIGVSLIFSFFMRYGGCEVMSIPGLLFQTRHTVYCPLNAVDVVEKALANRRARN